MKRYMAILIRVSRIFKGAFFGLMELLPFSVFCALHRFYGTRKRKWSILNHSIERMMNESNRVRHTKRIIAKGVPYFTDGPGRHNHFEIYAYVFDQYVREPVDYLEFGVAQGESINFALSKLGFASHIYGFDSFEGLPEEWYQGVKCGTFDNKGQPPPISAPNLTFVKGWFEKSLKPFLSSTQLSPHLVLNMDADIYSATIYVLRAMAPLLISGTIVIFDEYWFLKDEFRALQEFIAETGKQFEYLAVSHERAAIRFLN